MKRKLIILTLCFTIIFSSINFNKSYADGGVISLPILATVSALAVGTGIIINNNDDLYDIGRIFYDYINRHNDLTWLTVQSVFASSVSLQANKLVSVKSEFLNIVKDFFDNTFGNSSSDINVPKSYPVKPERLYIGKYFSSLDKGWSYVKFPSINENFNDVYLISSREDMFVRLAYKKGEDYISIVNLNGVTSTYIDSLYLTLSPYYGQYRVIIGANGLYSSTSAAAYTFDNVLFPYNGGYTWDNLDSKKDNESVALPIPGNLSSLVGQNSSDFWANTDNLVGSGNISIPNIENPSISLDNSISFPNTNVDTNNPSIDSILPAFPSFGDSLDFSPMYLTNVTEKFPFSLPWDIGRLIQKFDVDPVAPVFEIPIVSESITLDLTEFNELASIVRFFVLIGFILALIFISTKLMA